MSSALDSKSGGLRPQNFRKRFGPVTAGKLLLFTFKKEVSIVLHINIKNYQLKTKRTGLLGSIANFVPFFFLPTKPVRSSESCLVAVCHIGPALLLFGFRFKFRARRVSGTFDKRPPCPHLFKSWTPPDKSQSNGCVLRKLIAISSE